MANIRVAMVLEVATAAGALTGAFVAGLIEPRWLYVIFGLILGYSSLMMFRNRLHEGGPTTRRAPWADYLKLHSSYYDEAQQHDIAYRVVRTRVGLGLMYVAGIVSGLLGIGSGALKVPALDLAMHLPIKVSTATSNLMIGVTAAASAAVYFRRGDIDPFVAAPVATGVLVGAVLGAKLLGRLHHSTIRSVFIAILIWISLQMLWKGIHQ
jgi:uncharacterized membrane protein YfcA